MNADAGNVARSIVDEVRWIEEELWALHQNLMVGHNDQLERFIVRAGVWFRCGGDIDCGWWSKAGFVAHP